MDRRAIFTLAGWLLVSASAHAQPSSDVYYCVDEEATGFDFDKKHQKYEMVRFNPQRFTMKWDAAAKTVALNLPQFRQPTNFRCLFDVCYSCQSSDGHMFNFNPKTMKFILAYGFGHLHGDGNGGDSIAIAHGKCGTF